MLKKYNNYTFGFGIGLNNPNIELHVKVLIKGSVVGQQGCHIA